MKMGKYSIANAENIATEFSTSSTYAVGDYCTYQGTLYKCTTAISSAGAWDSSKWTATSVVENLGGGGSTVDVTTYDASVSRNPCNALTIDGTTYNLVPLGSNSNRNTNSLAIGSGSQVVASSSMAIGYNAKISSNNDSYSLAVGNSSEGSYQGTAIGYGTKAPWYGTAIGSNVVNYMETSVTFDGNAQYLTRIMHCYDANYIFFRNALNSSYYGDKYKRSYTTGYSLAERLNGLAITDNSVTEIDYDKTLIQTLSANVTWTFKAVPSSTGTNLSCKPEYKAVLTTSSAITVTLPSANTYLLKTNDTNITLATNVLSLPISANGIEINIKQIGSNFVILAMNWSV